MKIRDLQKEDSDEEKDQKSFVKGSE